MKRKIQFRGYNLKNKMWLYGYYFVNRGKHFITDDKLYPVREMTWEDFEVDPESVGQFVGEYKGVPIFGGDKVVVESDKDKFMHYVGIVRYDKCDCRFIVDFNVYCGLKKVPVTGEEQQCNEGMGVSYKFYYKYKVVGNEYEEKLKVSNP